MTNYIFILLCLISILPSKAQKLEMIQEFLLEKTYLEQILTIKCQHNKFYVPFYQNVQLYNNLGLSEKKISFQYRNPQKLKFKTRKRIIESLSFQPYKDIYAELNGDFLVLSDPNGYCFWKAEILPSKNLRDFKYEGIEIGIYPNIFQHPPMLLWQHYLVVSNWVVAYRNIKKLARKKTIDFRLLFEPLDTLRYLPVLPDLVVYDVNPPNVRYWNQSPMTEVDHDGKRLRFLRNIHINDGFSQRYWELARQNKFYPEPYMKFLAFDSVRKHIYFSRPHSASIYVVSLDGKHVKVFGQKGQHLSPTDTLRYIEKAEFQDLVRQKGIGGLQRLKDQYLFEKWQLSPIYHELHYDAVNNKTYRIYQKPVPYSVEAYRALAEKDPEKVDSMIFMRPHYLQIYDHNDGDRLIFDEAVPAPFHILEVKGDTLWAVAGVSDKGLKIVKYVMRKE